MYSDQAIDPLRWLVYLLVGAPLLTWLVIGRQEALRVVALLGILIIVQDNFAGRRWVWAFSVAPSFIVVYVALLALLFRGRFPRPGVFAPLWAALLFFAAVSAIAGSMQSDLIAENVDRYQVVFVEGLFFFLFGLVAIRSDADLAKALRMQSTWIGLAVAMIHFFTIATGFRFRSALRESEFGIYYGGVLSNPNALAAYYVMLIPVALSMLLRERLSPLMRLVTSVSLIAMSGSLVLTGGRSGILFTIGMCVVALVWSRLGFVRGAAAVVAAFVLALLGFELMESLVPGTWIEILGIAREEGFETGRFVLAQRYGAMMLEHPLGIGISTPNFQRLLPDYGIEGVVNSHNLYIDMGLQAGLLGLVTFLVMIGIILVRNRRALAIAEQHEQREALLYLFLLLLGYLANGYFQPIFSVYPKLNNLFWLLCGLSVAASERVFSAERARRRSEYEGEVGALRPPGHAQHA